MTPPWPDCSENGPGVDVALADVVERDGAARVFEVAAGDFAAGVGRGDARQLAGGEHGVAREPELANEHVRHNGELQRR